MADTSVSIVVDSACDLSTDFITENDIKILPIAVRFGDQLFIDRRDETATVGLYEKEFDKRGIDAETIPFSVEEITELLATRVAPRYDGALVLTISSTRSPIFENARKALFSNLGRLRQARLDVGRDEYFPVRVMDTETLFTGEAIIAHEAAMLVKNKKLPVNKLTAPLERLSKKVYAYLIPRDLYFVHKRAKKKGDNSIGWLSYKIGNMLDVKPIIQAHRGETEAIMKASGFDGALKKLLEHTMRQVKQGLAKPLITISYAGDLGHIRGNPVIQEFIKFAKLNKVEVMFSVMSTTAAINVGSGSFSLAFAAA